MKISVISALVMLAVSGLPTTMDPLTTTTWRQDGGYYNAMTPSMDDDKTVKPPVGCTATAFGQVLKYYDYPKRGLSSIAYCNSRASFCDASERVSVDFGATRYDWTNMPAILSSSSSEQAINATSTLLFHVGAAVKAIYGKKGTNAQIWNPNAFKGFRKHFYMVNVEQAARADYTKEAWETLIKNEVLNKRPVVLSGVEPLVDAGHAYIVDGVRKDGKVHVNFGWNGEADGYYDLEDINLEDTLRFTEDLVAFINFSPNSESEGSRCNGPRGLRCRDGLVCALGGDFKNVVDRAKEASTDEYGQCVDPTKSTAQEMIM